MQDVFVLAGDRYAAEYEIDFARVRRFVFICRGNVCRSPFAELLASRAGIDSISAGTDVRRSLLPPDYAISAANQHGIDLSGHRSKSLSVIEIRSTDCLVAMEPNHLDAVRSQQQAAGCQLTLLGLWHAPSLVRIDDPYGGQLDDFVICYDLISASVVGLLTQFQQVSW